MRTSRAWLLCAASGVGSAILLACARAAVAESTCQPVLAALNKVLVTPTHIYTTVADSNGAKTQSEQIFVHGSAYLKVRGQWVRSPVTPQQVAKMEQQNINNSAATCSLLHDEAIDGEVAEVYGTRAVRTFPRSNNKITSSGQIWISRSSGLPLRQEEDIDSAETGKEHVSARYVSKNVTAPL